ncbi:MAG: hypothetical protein N2044_09235 [Cyclobacteriaceae bacterium]|nr:hypothetical protein [Cyclobacteriaceae bacterium]MCX7638010.1 hypothetical protein [Cyclobacteriaceae bacterium]MDW8332150.1 hypothetical protein [Cyclobacteriaceae bacterium]
MKKFFLQFLITILTAFLFEQFLPWWSVALAAALGGFFIRASHGFLCGFLAIAILWLAKAWVIDIQSAQPLVSQVAKLLMMQGKWMLFAVTGITGGLAGGLGAWSGKAAGNLRG